MTDPILHPLGPEGRNAEAETFTLGMDAMARTLGWAVLMPRTDLLARKGRKSRGLDGLWVVRNPQTKRAEAWIPEGKRHDGPGRYSADVLREEFQTLRDKVSQLDRP